MGAPITSVSALLHDLFRYNAWANDELFAKLDGLDPELHKERRQEAIRLLNHCYVVNRIFAAHLTGAPHGYTANNTPETPALGDLRAAVAAMDRWYLDYLATVSLDDLAEPVPFVFTDGDRGRMSRQEMLTHVAVHGTYHRGEVGRILRQLSAPLPWDTFAVYLHQAQPERRDRASAAVA
jgi:uncharacterized damage-inducible protein DinB